MDGVGWMKVVCGSSGRAERGGDLAGDDAALADAGDDDAALAGERVEEEIDCLTEGREHRAVETERELEEGAGLDTNELGGEGVVCGSKGSVGHVLRPSRC